MEYKNRDEVAEILKEINEHLDEIKRIDNTESVIIYNVTGSLLHSVHLNDERDRINEKEDKEHVALMISGMLRTRKKKVELLKKRLEKL